MYFTGSADEALGEWLRVKDDLREGRSLQPQPDADAVTVKYLCDAFLTAKEEGLNVGELSPLTWRSYRDCAEKLAEILGRTRRAAGVKPDEWRRLRMKLAKTRGPVSLKNEIQRVRTIWKWGYESGLLDVPMRFGPDFRGASRKTLRLAKAEKGLKLLEASDLWRLIDAADVHMRAMIFLSLNCGYGNSDCGTLPLDRIDLKNGWATYHRPKTGVTRRCPLWPETIEALKASLAKRPAPKAEGVEKLVFVTRCGASWAKATEDNPIGKEFTKLLKSLGLHRSGVSFYVCRHVFRTIADGARDQPAAGLIMGHADESMAANYRQRIDDERLVLRHR